MSRGAKFRRPIPCGQRLVAAVAGQYRLKLRYHTVCHFTQRPAHCGGDRAVPLTVHRHVDLHMTDFAGEILPLQAPVGIEDDLALRICHEVLHIDRQRAYAAGWCRITRREHTANTRNFNGGQTHLT